jgi:hypothetical protein
VVGVGMIVTMIVIVTMAVIVFIYVVVNMIVIMVVIMIVVMFRMVFFRVISPVCYNRDLRAKDAVSLILHNVYFPTLKVKTGKTIGKSLPAYSKVKHRTEVHVATDA